MIALLTNISARERILLGAFLIVMLLIWGGSLLDRRETSGEQLREARKEVEQQRIWLESSSLFETQLSETLDGLDPAEMMDGSALSALVDSFARDNELRYELSEPSTTDAGVYSRSSVRVTFRNVPLNTLLRLNLMLSAKRPYLAAEAIALAANRADPRLLNARIDLAAIQVRDPSEEPNPARR